MFEHVDEIDWNALGFHIYGSHEKIPQEIRNLLSPDEAVREEALDFLLGGGQDFGSIYETTPVIVPFILEVLAKEGAPGKAALLRQLVGQGHQIATSGHLPIYEMDLYLRTYRAIISKLDLYFALLTNDVGEAQMAAVELLGTLSGDAQRVIPALVEQFNVQPDEDLQVAILSAIKSLLAGLDWKRYDLKPQYASFLYDIAENHASNKVRITAARAAVETIHPYDKVSKRNLPDEVMNLLIQEFINHVALVSWRKEFPLIYQEEIVQDLARLNPAPLLELIATPGLTPEQALLLARGLLANSFISYGKRQQEHWLKKPLYDKLEEGDYFVAENYAMAPEPVFKTKKNILQAIVNAEAVWARPTNLFSFFYGLPDNREQLREWVSFNCRVILAH